MHEYAYVAVIQRGGSGNCFPGGNLRGGKHSKLRSPFFPLALPLSGHAFFGAYVVVCVTFLVGRWIRQYRGRQAEPMDEGGRESGPRSGPVPCFCHKITVCLGGK